MHRRRGVQVPLVKSWVPGLQRITKRCCAAPGTRGRAAGRIWGKTNGARPLLDRPTPSMNDRLAMYNANALKLGLFGANCSSGRAVTLVPER